MAITAHVYTQNALVTLATYGVSPTVASGPNRPKSFMFVPCTTDVTEFDVGFIGTVSQLLTTGITEVAETGQYSKGKLRLPDEIWGAAVSEYNLIPGSWTARTVASSDATYANAINGFGPYDFRSLVLAWTLPAHTSSNGTTRYDNSFPIAMFDMGGLLTASGYLPVNWGGDPTISWTVA